MSASDLATLEKIAVRGLGQTALGPEYEKSARRLESEGHIEIEATHKEKKSSAGQHQTIALVVRITLKGRRFLASP